MRQASKRVPDSAEKTVRDIRRATRRHHSAEEKIRIVLEGLRGEDSIAELCRKEGINQNLYYRWSKEFLEAGKKRRPVSEGNPLPKGKEALETLYKEKPNEYVRAVLSVMPKEFAIENFTAGMSVDDIDELMAKIRDMLLSRESVSRAAERAAK